MRKEDKKAAPILLTDTETNHVAGGVDNGLHIGQLAQEQDVPAWTLNPGKAEQAPGHTK